MPLYVLRASPCLQTWQRLVVAAVEEELEPCGGVAARVNGVDYFAHFVRSTEVMLGSGVVVLMMGVGGEG